MMTVVPLNLPENQDMVMVMVWHMIINPMTPE